MFTNSTKITDKGQITIPKEVRDFLKSDVITFEILDDKVFIKPIKSVSGSLKEYSKDLGTFEDVRNLAWGKMADDWKK